MSKFTYLVTRYWKAIAGALGGLTATHVDWITQNIFQMDFTGEVDAAIALLVAGAIVALFPRNADKDTTVVENRNLSQ